MSIPTRWQLEKDICDAYEAKDHTSSALHGHYHFLLIYITRGRGVQTLNGSEIPFGEGDMFLLSPADFHKNTVAEGESYDYYGVKFPFELLRGRLSGLLEIGSLPIAVTLPEKSRAGVKSIFERLIEESAAGASRTAHRIYLQNMVEELIILALRELPHDHSESSAISTPTSSRISPWATWRSTSAIRRTTSTRSSRSPRASPSANICAACA